MTTPPFELRRERSAVLLDTSATHAAPVDADRKQISATQAKPPLTHTAPDETAPTADNKAKFHQAEPEQFYRPPVPSFDQRFRPHRLLIAALVAWFGAVAALSWFGFGSVLTAAIILAVGLLLTATYRRVSYPLRQILISVLVGVLAVICISVSGLVLTQHREPLRELVTQSESGKYLGFQAQITGKIKTTNHRSSVDARIVAFDSPDAPPALSLPVKLHFSPDAQAQNLAIGDLLHISATLSSDGFFSTKEKRSIAEGQVIDWNLIKPASGIFAWAQNFRAGLNENAAKLPQPGAALVPGLAVGDTLLVSSDLDAAMKRTSLTHLTAVSGANCAIIVTAAYLLGKLLLFPRKTRIFFALGSLTIFVIVVTPEPSVIRAAIMAVIAMLSLLIGRPAAGVSILSLAAIVLLIYDPYLSLEIGFILSVAASWALLVLTAPLTSALSRYLPKALALAIAVPLAAQLVCGPIIILLEPQLPLTAVIANLMAAPAAAPTTIIGLLAAVFAPVPGLGEFLSWCAWVFAAWTASCATFFASWENWVLPWLPGGIGAVALAVVSGLILLALIGVNAKVRRFSRLAVALGLIIILSFSIRQQFFLGAAIPNHWSIAICDVGQGDATVLKHGNRTMLIDTGNEPRMLQQCLDQLSISYLDLVVLSHLDDDHFGALPEVITKTGQVMIGAQGTEKQAEHDQVLQLAQQHGVLVTYLAAGERFTVNSSAGALNFETLWPPKGTRINTLNANDASVVLSLQSPNFPNIVLLGDLGAGAQHQLLASNVLPRGRVDVVKFAHHGSADQHPELYQHLSAKAAAISSAQGNSYGHPRAEALELLQDAGTTAFRTDQNGLILFWLNENGALESWWQRGEAPTLNR